MLPVALELDYIHIDLGICLVKAQVRCLRRNTKVQKLEGSTLPLSFSL